MNLNYGEMMSILKKIKLALLASAVMLSPQGAYALGSDSDDVKERGCIPQPNPCEALFEAEETRRVASSSHIVDPEIQTTIFIPRIPKETLDDISAKLSTIGATIKTFEIPEISLQSPQSPRKKEKPNKDMEARESLQISSPSATMEMKTPQNFEEILPALFLKFSERFENLRNGSVKDKLAFKQLYRSFMDVVKVYQTNYPDFQLIPEEMQRRHYIKRRHTMDLIGYKVTNSADEKKPTSIAQGDPLILSLQDSPLFQRRHVRGEESPSFSSSLPSQSSTVPPRPSQSLGESVIPSSPPVSPPPQRPSRPWEQKISSPPLSPSSPRSLGASPHQSSPALWVPSGFSGGSVIPSSLPVLHTSGMRPPLPRPRNGTSSSSQALCLPSGFSGKRDLPPPTPPQTPQKISPPQSPPVPLRLRSDLRPLPSLPRSVVSSSSRLLPQPPQSSGESVPPPPVAPRHRSLSLSPKATFSGLSPAGLSSASRK